jgi:glucosamine--fructose-6-phosphate aminotransferase (isomerizing)
MCGITARVGQDNALSELLVGLENLEYRGYDSAGVAVKNGTEIDVVKREGKIARLKERLTEQGHPDGRIGLGHTRWSTHGAPSDRNAHPHTDCTGTVAVVHNGIVENYDELRAELRADGHEFTSDTDTEVVPHLVERQLSQGDGPEDAFRNAVARLDGSYAIAMLVEDRDAVFATRQDSPLVLGLHDSSYYLASDVPAFLEFTDRVLFLEDGEVAVVEPGRYRVTDLAGRPVDRQPRTVDWTPDEVQKGEFDHFMLKEIYEQPMSLAQTVQGRLDPDRGAVDLEAFPRGSLSSVTDVHFVGCGTSYHAAMYARRLYLAHGIQAQVTRAGEFANGRVPMRDDTLVVGVTQSGETADTLAALRQADDAGARTLALTNTVGSTAPRECDDAMFIRAGPEIGVAATKTFSSQIAALAMLGHRLARDRDREPATSLSALAGLPDLVGSVLEGSGAADVVARHLDRDAYFFIGRGIAHPVALEGALKFKEISYEHAEGFSSSQLKHGPLALVTPDTTVFAVFTGRHDQKTLSNVREVQARGATVVAVASEADAEIAAIANEVIPIPEASPEVAGVLANVQLQLVSYHVADRLGRSIDKPRNLAKSVTVE